MDTLDSRYEELSLETLQNPKPTTSLLLLLKGKTPVTVENMKTLATENPEIIKQVTEDVTPDTDKYNYYLVLQGLVRRYGTDFINPEYNFKHSVKELKEVFLSNDATKEIIWQVQKKGTAAGGRRSKNQRKSRRSRKQRNERKSRRSRR